MSKLALGTAQFGLDYGISNMEGKTGPSEINAILRFAQSNKIELIDTAHSYGESEAVIGEALSASNKFRIITKTPVFNKQVITPKDAGKLRDIFFESLSKLGMSKLQSLLIHNPDDLFVPGGDILFSALDDLKQMGYIEQIGASVYTKEQIDNLLNKFSIDIIQLPVNLVDHHLIQSGHLKNLKKAGIEIHARSIFLQGMLLIDPDKLHSFFNPVKPVIRRYRDFLNKSGYTPVDGALGFAKCIDEIDYIIIGVNNLNQLKSNIDSFNKLYDESFLEGIMAFSISDPKYLNPTRWKLQ